MSFEIDRRAENAAAVGFEQRGIDDLRVGELGLELGDAALDEALALLGRGILGVLGKVAVRRASAMAVMIAGRCAFSAPAARRIFAGAIAGQEELCSSRPSCRCREAWPPVQALARQSAQLLRLRHAGAACARARERGEKRYALLKRCASYRVRISDRRASVFDGVDDQGDLAVLDHVDDVRPAFGHLVHRRPGRSAAAISAAAVPRVATSVNPRLDRRARNFDRAACRNRARSGKLCPTKADARRSPSAT